MKMIIHPYNLELEHTFTITHESRNFQNGLVVELQHEGFSGFGEASATTYYGQTLEGMIEKLESLRLIIESSVIETPEKFWDKMAPYLEGHPFELCALDLAAHDLYGQMQGMPTYKVWGLSINNLPNSNYTIGRDTIEVMVEKMKAKPWPLYKIKLGTDHDQEIIRELRKHTDAKFRIDANTAWTAEETIENAPVLKELGVEFLEQPLKTDDWEGLKKAYTESVLPIIADESCQVESDVDKCHGHFHGINIKLVKCGGLTPARRMIKRAKELGMKVMVGCMTESSIGISAIAHLLPMLDYVDMDGALLLKEDIAEGVIVKPDGVEFPDRNGIGGRLKK
jgi:L-alanine-DL-glutamate epimerase-like enolase superfamily enzyme